MFYTAASEVEIQAGKLRIRWINAIAAVRVNRFNRGSWSMGKNTINLEFTFDYEPHLVTAVERRPRLCFYLSGDAGRAYTRVNPATDSNRIRLPVEVGNLQADSTLTIFAFVDTVNARNEPSSNEAGSAWVYLKDVMSAVHEKQESLKLVVWNARRSGVDAVKGSIKLHFERANFTHGKSPFAMPDRYAVVPSNKQFVIETLVNYLARSNAIFEKKQSTYASVANLHMPTWNFSGWAVPGSAFGMVRAKHSPEAWWSNAVDIALRRHFPKMSLAAARTYITTIASETEVMIVVSKMHSVFINHCTYLSDGIPVEKRSGVNLILLSSERSGSYIHIPMEAFSNNIRSRGSPVRERSPGRYDYVPPSADCEDGGAAQGHESMELRNRNDWTDPVLKRMHAVRQNYFYLQVLMGVRGAQLSDGDDGARAYEQLGGHMAGAYISREAFMKMHRRYNSAAEPYKNLKINTEGVRAPIMFLEGTGLIDPAASQQYSETMRSYRYLNEGNSGVFSGIKFIAPQNNSKLNAFYRVVQSVTVLDLADEGYSAIEHVMLRRDPRTGRTTTGVSHLEFVNEEPQVETYAMPAMTEHEVRVVKQILKQTPPIEAFEVPERKSAERAVEPNLEAIREIVEKQNRPRSDNYDVVQFYPRFDQLSSLKEKWADMARSKKRLFKMKYFNEETTKGFGGYHVQFFVSQDE